MSNSIGDQYLIEEYKALWEYYKQTLRERKNLFDWFLLIITIPSSAIGFLYLSKLDPVANIPLNFLGACVLLVVFLIGLSLFITYVLESRNAGHYMDAVDLIRDHIRDTNPDLVNALQLDVLRSPTSHLAGIDSIKFFRSFVFMLIDSSIISTVLYLLKSPNFVFECFVASFFMHISIFLFLNVSGMVKTFWPDPRSEKAS